MKKDFFKKNWQLLIFNAILFLVFVLAYGRFGDINVDSFREAYIPECILNGQVLYKDIFTIYAPFAYLFNAFLFMIFGIKLKVLYLAGFAATAGILNLFFAISKKFIAKTYGLAIILLVISASVLSPNVFNFIFPYSYGMLYGMLFALLSVCFAIRKNYSISFLMYSFSVCSKYEFLLLLPVLVWSYIHNKKAGIEIADAAKNIVMLLLPVFFVFLPLFIMGMGLENLIVSLQLLGEMGKTETLHRFYSASGLVFRPELLLVYAANFIKILVPILLLQKFKNKILYFLVLIYLFFAATPAIMVFLFPLIFILFCLNYKELNHKRQFLVVAFLAISLKVFFALTMLSYGCLFLPMALLSFYIVCPKKYKKSAFAITLMLALVFGMRNSYALFNKNVKIETDRGVVYTSKYYEPIKNVVEYVSKNTNITDKVVVYPEGLVINFLTGRSSDSKMYSLIPLYSEIFNDNIVIARLEMLKPQYVIISNYDTFVYGVPNFGKDYAINVNKYVQDRYKFVKKAGKEFNLNIFELKD